MTIERGRRALAAADRRFGHCWWAPLGYVLVLLRAAVRR